MRACVLLDMVLPEKYPAMSSGVTSSGTSPVPSKNSERSDKYDETVFPDIALSIFRYEPYSGSICPGSSIAYKVAYFFPYSIIWPR